ncbi:MAG TPA: ATP-binding protein [Gemmataceae bacterium]|nr:ATP-binding protein [Gemmataceae bacterium]
MTLVNRLSLFFLAALAVVLVGYSVLVYTLVRTYLFFQIDHRAHAALDVLAAAVDRESEGLEWDPSERQLPWRDGESDGTLIWGVFDERGRFVDGTREAAAVLNETLPGPLSFPIEPKVTWQGTQWQISQRTLGTEKATSPANATQLPHNGDTDKPRYRQLDLSVGVPVTPVYATLRWLAAALTGFSIGVWAIAAWLGRLLCRRALAPMNQMAQTAREITSADLNCRLPQTGTRDELEDLAKAFNDLLGRLQDSFERQRRFTGEASHQLRTPLTAMLGQVEVTLRRERSSEDYRRVLAAVQEQSQQMRQIIEMLLFLAQTDQEARLPEMNVVDLARWLPEHLRTWRQHARFSDIRAECAPSVPIRVHAGLLGQALDNLLDNACKYSPPDTPIIVRACAEDRGGCIAVEDQGYGLAGDDISHLFQSFFRSSDARRRGITGVGLGLAITSRIISSFGGRIHVTSQPGQGSRFVIWLPIADAGSIALEGAPPIPSIAD